MNQLADWTWLISHIVAANFSEPVPTDFALIPNTLEWDHGHSAARFVQPKV
jgi:hypothetical protein